MNRRSLEHLHQVERDALHAVKAALAREFGGDFVKLVLFGSRARGQACGWAECPDHVNPDDLEGFTDLDVVIMLRDASWENHKRARRAMGNIDMDHGVVFDVKYDTPEGWADGLDRELLFYEEVEREGIEI